MVYLINRQALASAGVDQQTIEALQKVKRQSEQADDTLSSLADAPVVLLSPSGVLPKGRTLSPGAGLNLADGGAGQSVELSLAETGVEPGAYGNAGALISIVVDRYGRITGVSAIPLVSDNVTEGEANLYFTADRARASVSGGQNINYDQDTGEIALDRPLDGGTYEPMFTGTGNVAAIAGFPATWSRVGSIVAVAGCVNVTPAAASGICDLSVSLPVPSAVEGANWTLAGQACVAITGTGGITPGNGVARMRFQATGTTVVNVWYHYQYVIRS